MTHNNIRFAFFLSHAVDAAYINSQLAVTKSDTFEEWLIRISTLLIKTEVNVQLGEFTIKKNAIQPLPPNFAELPDFSVVLKDKAYKDILQCAVIEQKTNRTWIRLVGLGHDLLLWTPDERLPRHTMTEAYETTSPWIREMLDPWMEKLFCLIPLFTAPASTLHEADMVTLYGYMPSPRPGCAETLKEVVVYRFGSYAMCFNVFQI